MQVYNHHKLSNVVLTIFFWDGKVSTFGFLLSFKTLALSLGLAGNWWDAAFHIFTQSYLVIVDL